MGFWTIYMGIEGGGTAALAQGFVQVAFAARQTGITFAVRYPGINFGEGIMGEVTRLSDFAQEEGTFAVDVSFTDEDGDALTPDSVTWTLSALDGTIINSRQDVAISPDSTVTIILTGDDLAIQSSTDNRRRRLTIEGTYTSSLGSGIPLTAECEFMVANFVGIT